MRQLVWPDSGPARASRYLWERIKRMRATPHAIAAGFAAGAAVSFLPLIGLHFVLGFALAWATRGSLPASALGTAVGNPLTFPVFFAAAHRLGLWMTGADAPADADLSAREAEALTESLSQGLAEGLSGSLSGGVDLGALAAVWPTLKLMLIGALPIAAVAWVVFYVVVRQAAERVHEARAARRAARVAAATGTVGGHRTRAESLEGCGSKG